MTPLRLGGPRPGHLVAAAGGAHRLARACAGAHGISSRTACCAPGATPSGSTSATPPPRAPDTLEGPIRLAETPGDWHGRPEGDLPPPRLGSVLHRFRQQASLLGARTRRRERCEMVGSARSDAGLDQLEVLGVTEAELVEALGLGSADVTRRRAALRVGILVVSKSAPASVRLPRAPRLRGPAPWCRPRCSFLYPSRSATSTSVA